MQNGGVDVDATMFWTMAWHLDYSYSQNAKLVVITRPEEAPTRARSILLFTPWSPVLPLGHLIEGFCA